MSFRLAKPVSVKEALGEYEALWHMFEALDLRFVEKVLSGSYGRKSEVGRPHRNLLGMFKADLVKRFGRIEYYEELYRLMMVDSELRELCDVKEWEKPYHPSILSRFRRRIGPECLQQLVNHALEQLDRIGVLNGETVALDAAFVKAYSRRDPQDSSRGLSDSEARLRKQGRNVTLGYGVHLAVDTCSEMPSAVMVEPANVNEKKTAPKLLSKAVKRQRKVRSVVADSQYSSEAFRDKVKRLNAEPVIPYPRNQMKGKKVLRVDRRFRPHGPTKLKRLYRRRPAAERAISRLKHYFGLKHLRTRGLRNALIHTLFCILAMLITALASILHGHTDLIRSPVSLMKLTGRL
jgi:transposase